MTFLNSNINNKSYLTRCFLEKRTVLGYGDEKIINIYLRCV